MSWTIQELAKYFSKLGISESLYSFYKEKDDAICLDRRNQEWLIYYSERGHIDELAWAKTESQALDVMRLYVLSHSGKFI